MALWQLIVQTPEAQGDIISDWLEEIALSVGIDLLDDGQQHISATFEEKPDEAAIAAHLAVLQQLEPSIAYNLQPVDMNDWLAMVGRTEGAGRIGEFRLLDAPAPSTQLLTYKDIYVEAFGAFGDGYHPTTQGCLLALQWLGQRCAFRNIADIGCGSGVLALSARKIWPCASLVASDLDPRSVRTTKRNRAHNAASKMSVTGGAGFGARLIGQKKSYDLILMNILARPLSKLAAPAAQHLEAGGYLILSGLLERQIGMVLAAYRAQRLALVRQSVQDGWVTLILQKRA